jgi:TetR/AcrR family fatty acid metabolism transcriptional regulator
MQEQIEKKRRLIIDSAVAVFARMGYYNSRVSDIVKKADVAYGLFYHYFPSKDDILVVIFQNAWGNLLTKLEKIDKAEGDPVEKIKASIKYIFDSYNRNPALMKVLIMDVPRLDRFYDEDNQRVYNQFFKKISKFVKEGQKKGVIAKSINPDVASYVVHGSVDAIIRQYVYNPDLNEKTLPTEKTVGQVTAILMDGFMS